MELLGITITGWGVLVVALSTLILAGLMFILGSEKIHFIWGIFCLAVSFWAGSFYMIVLAESPNVAESWWKISYIGVILIAVTFFHFVLEFTDNKYFHKIKWFILGILYLAALGLIYLNLQTNLIIDGTKFLFEEIFYGQPGVLHPYFTFLYISLVLSALLLVYIEYRRKINDKVFSQRAGYFFFATFIAFAGASMIFLPFYGIETPPATSITIAIGAAIVSYAILRYRLLNVHVVTAQLLTLILSGFATIRFILSESIEEYIFNAIFLLVVLLVGIYLILSVRKEVEQRERIERLAKDLEEANKAQENLIHFITHQVKGFFTKSRNIFAELLDGTFGKINGEVKQMAEEGLRANTEAVGVVENILKASNIKKGTIEYEKKEIDLKKMVEEAVEKMKPIAEKKGLDFQTDIKEGDYNFVGDRTQLEQVFHNLMDNAVKYTPVVNSGIAKGRQNSSKTNSAMPESTTGYTPKGEVKVSLVKSDNSIKFSVKDSGVGITPEDKKRLFTEGGKGKDSTKVNVDSTGYGLYIVKGIVEAHGGKVWAESEGQGKGSTFVVELPA